MKAILNVFALAAVLASATFASADIIGSWANSNPGFDNTAVVYGGFNAPTISFTPGSTSASVAFTPHHTCQTGPPNCTVPILVTLSTFVNGTNVLELDVSRTNLFSPRLDFYGPVTTPGPVPELGTLLLLGTGLFGSAGALFRSMRS